MPMWHFQWIIYNISVDAIHVKCLLSSDCWSGLRTYWDLNSPNRSLIDICYDYNTTTDPLYLLCCRNWPRNQVSGNPASQTVNQKFMLLLLCHCFVSLNTAHDTCKRLPAVSCFGASLFKLQLTLEAHSCKYELMEVNAHGLKVDVVVVGGVLTETTDMGAIGEKRSELRSLMQVVEGRILFSLWLSDHFIWRAPTPVGLLKDFCHTHTQTHLLPMTTIHSWTLQKAVVLAGCLV